MARSKTSLFDSKLAENARYFKALAHPARLQILKFLASSKSCITGDISDDLPLSRTTVNQHIKELKEIGIIDSHVEGVTTKYCLNIEMMEAVMKSHKELFESFNLNDYKC